MSQLRRQNLIIEYHYRQVMPGTDFSQAINAQMDAASIILLLISANFLASDSCYAEMQKALERQNTGTAHVIPVLLSPVDLHGAPFAHLRCLPGNKLPITRWTNREEAFRDVAAGIRTTLENLYGIHLGPTHHVFPSMRRDHRTRLLKQVRAFWINGVLERSLHQISLITLGLDEQPDAVANPFRLTMQEAKRPASSLPPGTHILNVYDDSDGKLLLLGKPGSGKTTLLLELTRELLTRAEQEREYPIPVVFRLSSWKGKEKSFVQWLTEELHSKYQLPLEVGRTWIEADNITLLLDGLDEIDHEKQKLCIQAINTYHQEHHLVSIVLCSRSTEYFAQVTHVMLQIAVEIQPLTPQQVNEYLLKANKDLAALRLVLSTDEVLRTLATNPLMLNVMSLAYYGKDVKDIVVEDPEKELLGMQSPVLTIQSREIFTAYVHEMLHRRGSSRQFSSQQIIHWLSWIAKNSGGGIYAMQFRRPGHPYFSDLAPLVLSNLPTVGVLLACFGIATRNLLCSLILLCLEIVPLSLIMRGSYRYITSGGDPFKTKPSIRAMKYSSILVEVFYIIFALFFQQRWLIILLGISTLVGCCAFLWLFTNVLYLLDRIRLYLKGDIPWNYDDFLDYATEHILLHKVGERHIFIHNLLYDYFRLLNTTSPKKKFRRRTTD